MNANSLGRVWALRSWRWTGICGLALLFIAGCDGRKVETPKPVPQPASQPAATTMPTTAPAASGMGDGKTAMPKPASDPKPKPAVPKRPESTWALFRAAFDPESDAICEAKFAGGNRLDVNTENISHLTLDLRNLPAGAPSKGPWNLQIDEQGIEVSGRRGRFLHLVRTKAGAWSVDNEAYK